MWPGSLPIAHGALGILDELLLLLAIGIFVFLLGAPTLSALLNKKAGEDAEDTNTNPAPGQRDAADAQGLDHYRLE